MRKHCRNCAVYDRKNMKHSELCGKCVTEHFPNGKESDPSMWKPMPQTNADRIRAMSDEELAELFGSIIDDGKSCSLICSDLDKCRRNNSIERICKNHYLKWLKQPAEGE